MPNPCVLLCRSICPYYELAWAIVSLRVSLMDGWSHVVLKICHVVITATKGVSCSKHGRHNNSWHRNAGWHKTLIEQILRELNRHITIIYMIIVFMEGAWSEWTEVHARSYMTVIKINDLPLPFWTRHDYCHSSPIPLALFRVTRTRFDGVPPPDEEVDASLSLLLLPESPPPATPPPGPGLLLETTPLCVAEGVERWVMGNLRGEATTVGGTRGLTWPWWEI